MAILNYFNGRGLGELVRLTLCAAKIQFEENLITTREAFLKLKEEGKLLFAQVPMLEIDDKCIVQVRAIVGYVADSQGLYGTNPGEKCRINMLFEGARDFQMAFVPIGFRDQDEVLKAASDTMLPKMLPIFEKELEGSSSGFLVGDSISLADCSLLEALLSCLDYFGEKAFTPYPNIQKYVKHLKSDEGIQYYLKEVRKRPNDKNYIKDVGVCLGRA